MQADFSVELGRDAPALEIPWRSDDTHVRYFDLKIHPEMVLQIPEAIAYPELTTFLSRINAPGFPLATAKCDAWSSSEVSPEEEVFGDRKFVSYIDLIFVDQEDRCSLEKHEAFARELCRLLSHAPEIAAAVELVIRHCYYHQEELRSEKSGELTDPESSATMRASEISASGNNDATSDDRRADIAIDDEFASVKEHDECRDHAKNRDEQRDLLAWHKPAELMDCVAPYSSHAHATDPHGVSRVTERELAALSDRQQSSSRESERADLAKHADLLRMSQSEESANVPREPKPGTDGPTDSVTGFCITAYVTGFGNHDHDPVRRWAIALYLLQNAIVQLNCNLQQKL